MKQEELDKIRVILQPLMEKNRVLRAILFGSAARDEETRHSDIDLMIVMDTEKRFFDRYDAFEEVYDNFKGRSVDLLIYTPEELEDIRHRSFIKRILQEGKVLYEH